MESCKAAKLQSCKVEKLAVVVVRGVGGGGEWVGRVRLGVGRILDVRTNGGGCSTYIPRYLP
jgi:hypothetical protein